MRSNNSYSNLSLAWLCISPVYLSRPLWVRSFNIRHWFEHEFKQIYTYHLFYVASWMPSEIVRLCRMHGKLSALTGFILYYSRCPFLVENSITTFTTSYNVSRPERVFCTAITADVGNRCLQGCGLHHADSNPFVYKTREFSLLREKNTECSCSCL